MVKRPGELGVVTIAQKIPPATHADYAPLRVLAADFGRWPQQPVLSGAHRQESDDKR